MRNISGRYIDFGAGFERDAIFDLFLPSSVRNGKIAPDAMIKVTQIVKPNKMEYGAQLMEGSAEIGQEMAGREQEMVNAFKNRFLSDIRYGKNYKYVYGLLHATGNQFIEGMHYQLVVWADKTDNKLSFWFAPVESLQKAAVKENEPIGTPATGV